VVDLDFELRGVRFTWDVQKAASNEARHGVSFEEAAEAFFDPFLRVVDASPDSGVEQRDAVIGYDAVSRLLFVVHVEPVDDHIRIISARRAGPAERKRYEDQ
jgi:uncharacterized DUF497 family protein